MSRRRAAATGRPPASALTRERSSRKKRRARSSVRAAVSSCSARGLRPLEQLARRLVLSEHVARARADELDGGIVREGRGQREACAVDGGGGVAHDEAHPGVQHDGGGRFSVAHLQEVRDRVERTGFGQEGAGMAVHLIEARRVLFGEQLAAVTGEQRMPAVARRRRDRRGGRGRGRARGSARAAGPRQGVLSARPRAAG